MSRSVLVHFWFTRQASLGSRPRRSIVLPWAQVVAGSNPAAPTTLTRHPTCSGYPLGYPPRAVERSTPFVDPARYWWRRGPRRPSEWHSRGHRLDPGLGLTGVGGPIATLPNSPWRGPRRRPDRRGPLPPLRHQPAPALQQVSGGRISRFPRVYLLLAAPRCSWVVPARHS